MKIIVKKPKSNNDFAEMLEASFIEKSNFTIGQIIDSQVLGFGREHVFIALNGKSEGIISKDELLNENGELKVKEGDAIRAFFLKSMGGELWFTTKIGQGNAGPEMLEQAFNQKLSIEGQVIKEIKGGYEVKIGESLAFCPFSQMGFKSSEAPDFHIGKTYTFRIQEYREAGRKLVVSQRVLLEEAHQENLNQEKGRITEGAILSGKVTAIHDYGAFIDLGGVQALLPASEISRSHVDDISKVLSVGQDLQVKVLKTDWAKERISVSLKSLQKDPWDDAKEKYIEESTHEGVVARITNFGAFVTLEPGIDGLLPISEIRANSNYATSKDLTVKKGQTIRVMVMSIDSEQRRIALRPVSPELDDEESMQYVDKGLDEPKYNPFAALLKKK